jgi:hypothetical protein
VKRPRLVKRRVVVSHAAGSPVPAGGEPANQGLGQVASDIG